MADQVKSIKNLGVFSIIVSIFFFLIFLGCVGIEFAMVHAINHTEGLIVIFIILLGIVIMFIAGLVGIISLILFILNLSTGITVVRKSSSFDELYNKKGRIKFSIWVLRITAVILFVGGVVLLVALFKSFEAIYLVIAIASLVLSISSFVMVNKANKAFKDIIKVKQAETFE